jgi:hypothetical protein
MNGSRKCVSYTQWNFTQPQRRMKFCHSQVNEWNWRTSFGVRLARLRRPNIIYFPSYVDFRSRANTAMWLDLDHMTRGKHITGDMGIGRKSKAGKSLMSPLQRN